MIEPSTGAPASANDVPPSSRDFVSLASTGADAPTPSTQDAAAALGPCPPAGNRFTILRLHAQGGLGQVSLARDERLKRSVALKEIRPDKRDNTYLRQRFLTEAEITGQLEHPGIVPIYDLDQDADGQVRYAMRFVLGRTLQDAIRTYHAQPTPLGLRELLQRFISVCQTVAYAHSQGVIHRDLKPANVLLGDYGETLVVDWGLAKRLAPAPPTAAVPANAAPDATAAPEQTTDLVPAAGDPLTQAGQVLGTPAYMAPEQAAGDIDGTSTPADIYGLGAILYELLTGRPPYQGETAAAVLAAVRQGHLTRPRQVRPGVPRALEAVCLKALAGGCTARYADAAALARDVEHWLADEPVSVVAEPWPERARRWTRRHRPLVAGALALLVTTVGALAVGIALLGREQQRTDAARRDAEASADRTRTALAAKEKQERRTRAALDTLTDDAVEQLLQRKDELSPEDRAFLRKVLAHYEGFAADAGNDESSRRAVAETYGRVAQFRLRLGEHQAADEAFRRAAALFAALAADFPAEPAYRFGEQRNRHNLAALFRQVNRGAEAVALLRGLIPERRRLADEYLHQPQYRTELASGLTSLGVLLRERGEHAEAEKVLNEAIQARRQLVATDPAAPYRAELAASLNNLGILYWQGNNLAAAEPLLRETVRLRHDLAEEFPRRAEYRNLLACSHNNLGVLCADRGQPAQAVAEYRLALAIRRQLAAERPTVPEYRANLASTLNNLAVSLKKQGKLPDAEEAYREALAVQERLAAYFPESLLYAVALGNTYGNLGNLALNREDHAAAVSWYAKAIPTLEAVLAKDAKQVSARRFLRNAYQCRAQARAALHQDADAVQDWDRALALNPGTRRDEFRVFRALSQARADAPDQAVTEIKTLLGEPKLAARFPGWVPYTAARIYAVAAAGAKEEPERSARYAVQVMTFLQQARTAGYFQEAAHVRAFRTEPDFGSVRGRPDFQKWCNELTGTKP